MINRIEQIPQIFTPTLALPQGREIFLSGYWLWIPAFAGMTLNNTQGFLLSQE